MEKALLFTVPVYSMPKETFDKRWERFYQEAGVEKEHRYIFRPQNEWKFNQVIAYIEIFKNGDDIDFEIYKSKSNQFRYNSIQKGYEHFYSIGNHFNVSSSDTNDSIKESILDFLEGFKSELGYKSKQQFLFLDAFNAQFELMNIRRLFYPE